MNAHDLESLVTKCAISPFYKNCNLISFFSSYTNKIEYLFLLNLGIRNLQFEFDTTPLLIYDKIIKIFVIGHGYNKIALK